MNEGSQPTNQPAKTFAASSTALHCSSLPACSSLVVHLMLTPATGDNLADYRHDSVQIEAVLDCVFLSRCSVSLP